MTNYKRKWILAIVNKICTLCEDCNKCPFRNVEEFCNHYFKELGDDKLAEVWKIIISD